MTAFVIKKSVFFFLIIKLVNLVDIKIDIISHNNPCFPCKIAITNFLVSHTCKIRFHYVIDRAVRKLTSRRHPTKKFQNMAEYVWDPYLSKLVLKKTRQRLA